MLRGSASHASHDYLQLTTVRYADFDPVDLVLFGKWSWQMMESLDQSMWDAARTGVTYRYALGLTTRFGLQPQIRYGHGQEF